MILLSGKRKTRIKQFIDNKKSCKNCGDFDFEVKIYRIYWHLFFLPIKPSGKKTTEIKCRSCGYLIHSDILQRHYEKGSYKKMYFYTIPILLVSLIAALLFSNENKNPQNTNTTFMDNPKIADVFTNREKDDVLPVYHFLGTAGIKGYVASAVHNDLKHYDLTTVLNDHDLLLKGKKKYFLNPGFKADLYKMERNTFGRNYDEQEVDYHNRK